MFGTYYLQDLDTPTLRNVYSKMRKEGARWLPSFLRRL